MRKGESNRTGRPFRPASYAGRKFYAPSMRHRAERLEQAISDAIRERIELTREQIVTELIPETIERTRREIIAEPKGQR